MLSNFKGNQNKKQAGRSLYDRFFTKRTRQPNFFFSLGITAIKITLILVLVLSVGGVGVVLGVAKAYYETTPELTIANITDQSLSSFVYDRNGMLMTSYKGAENRIWATYDEIPKDLVNAFVAVEDARFFTHNGVDVKRIVGAFVNNMRNDSVQGGSTITQQLVKTRILSMEQTYKRKIQEAYIAMEMEKEYDKEQILEWYLNTIPLGGSNYGVKAAAKDYFGKELSELTMRECAGLAAITRNPTRYNPRRSYYVVETPEVFVDRANYVLLCMYEYNFITRDEYTQALGGTPALQEDLKAGNLSEAEYRDALRREFPVVEETTVNTLYDMPAAVETVLYDVATALLAKNGLPDTTENRQAMRREIQTGGYSIYSTIDPQVQKIVEETVYNWEDWPKTKNRNHATLTKTDTATGIRYEVVQPQAAFSVFDYVSGEIVAVVGGRTPPTNQLELNRAMSAMSVGSAIKPIAVYGPALDMGASPGSVESNLPLPITGWESERGYPANSTAGNFKGYVTLRQGMRSSLNIVAANTLLNRVGVNESRNYLVSMGISPDHVQNTPFGVALGGSGITPIEMSVAFGTVANSGTYQMPLTFTKVVDSSGQVVLDMKEQQQANTRQVFRPGTAWMLVDMLEDAVRSGTGSRAKISGMTVGGKTGTNSDYKGVTFSGFTPYYSAAVWIGHDEDQPLDSANGGRAAAPLWQAVMEKIHKELELEDRPVIEASPESLGLVKATICPLSGKLASEACALDSNFPPVSDWFHSDSVPTETCTMHAIVEVCTESGLAATQYCPQTEKRAVILLPPGHAAEKLTQQQRDELLPNAILNVPEGATPEQLSALLAAQGKVCAMHTSQVPAPDDDLLGGNGEQGQQPWEPVG